MTKLMMKLNASFMLQVRGRPLIALHPASSQFIFKDGVPKSKMPYVQRKCMHATLKHIFEEAREASNGNGLRMQTPNSRPGSSLGVAAQFAARFLFVRCAAIPLMKVHGCLPNYTFSHISAGLMSWW